MLVLDWKAASCFHQVVEGVAYLHSQGIGHRDLKPENILLALKDDPKSVKIADFGFAKDLGKAEPGKEGDGHLTATGLGTFGYVAPEIIARKTRYDGLQCDCWSLGVILFILCSGEAPFRLGGNSAADKRKVLHAAYKYGPSWDKVSEHPKKIVDNLLKVNPKERWTSQKTLEQNWVQNDGKFVEGWTYSGPSIAAAPEKNAGGAPVPAVEEEPPVAKKRSAAAKKDMEREDPGCGCGTQ